MKAVVISEAVVKMQDSYRPGLWAAVQGRSSQAGKGQRIMEHRALAQCYREHPRIRAVGLGDRVEKAVKPIAKALDLRCLDKEGNLLPDSRCARRRDWLNRVGRKVGV